PQTMPSVTSKISPDPRNADAAMCLLGIAAPNKSRVERDPDAILLEPWAVQAALRRRRGGKALTMKDIGDIERCTRAPETLRWPRRRITRPKTTTPPKKLSATVIHPSPRVFARAKAATPRAVRAADAASCPMRPCSGRR